MFFSVRAVRETPCRGKKRYPSEGLTKSFAHVKGASYAIFVEPVVPVGSAKMYAFNATNLLPFGLRFNGLLAELWMGVMIGAKDLVGINVFCVVECYAKRGVAFNSLQNIHVIGKCSRGVVFVCHPPQIIIPAGPGEFATR